MRKLAVLLLLPLSLFAAETPISEAAWRVERLIEPMVGHRTGGMTADRAGFIYMGDFSGTVFRMTAEGVIEPFVTTLYGASGNDVDGIGNLIQAEYYAGRLLRIDRAGTIEVITDELQGPIGVAYDAEGHRSFVADCVAGQIVEVSDAGDVRVVAASPEFDCPNGILLHPDGDLYTVNFGDNKMLRVTPDGEVSVFARVSDNGLGHLAYLDGFFYVTAFHSHQIYRVDSEGAATLIAGSNVRGSTEGPALDAQLSFPNGIIISQASRRIVFNEIPREVRTGIPRVVQIRQLFADD